MTLFIDQQSGESYSVFSDLYTISLQDGGLGDTPLAGDPTVAQVTYVETAGQGATADRLNHLVNTDFGTPIVMTALPGGIDPYSGIDLTGNGATYIDSSSGSPVVRVVYDSTQCNGNGIFAYDVNGNQITFPDAPLLYHELSHALRAATGTLQPNDEPPAETDENVMRSALGLCQRDINNHGGGCGPGDSCGGGTTCFIVSAATGSKLSSEVLRLKQLRDRIVRSTELGAALLDEIYRDYYRFSPRVAADIFGDSELRDLTREALVEPLLAWYALAEQLCLNPTDTDAIERATRTVTAKFSRSLEVLTEGPEPDAAEDHRRNRAEYFEHAGRRAAERPFSRWAITQPFLLGWCTASTDGDAVSYVRDWLADAPLDALAPPAADTLNNELAFLTTGPVGPLAQRMHLGRKLAASWPQAESLLALHGFIQSGETQ